MIDGTPTVLIIPPTAESWKWTPALDIPGSRRHEIEGQCPLQPGSFASHISHVQGEVGQQFVLNRQIPFLLVRGAQLRIKGVEIPRSEPEGGVEEIDRR